MTKEELKNFLHIMGKAVLEAGELAKSMQGKVENIGKYIDHAKEGTAEVADVAEAKTVIDEQVQEILLKAAAQCLDTKSVVVDGEEKTPSLALFPNKKGDITLVLDPIDGTLPYLKGEDTYNVVVGLIENGKITSALVYLPARDTLYFLNSNGNGSVAKNFSKTRFANVQTIKKITPRQERIFVTYRTSNKLIRRLKKEGYTVVRDIELRQVNWTKAFLGFLDGTFSVLLFQSPQIRDILLGVIITANSGYVLDWQGKPLVWSPGGRVPKVLFSIGKPQKNILKLLQV